MKNTVGAVTRQGHLCVRYALILCVLSDSTVTGALSEDQEPGSSEPQQRCMHTCALQLEHQ
jgi:hypothetical protein